MYEVNQREKKSGITEERSILQRSTQTQPWVGTGKEYCNAGRCKPRTQWLWRSPLKNIKKHILSGNIVATDQTAPKQRASFGAAL